VPGVAQPDGPAQRGVAVAADPERDVPAPVVRLVPPRGPDREQVLVGQPAALAERDAERAELLPGPADAHPEDQAPAAEIVEVGGHPRDQQRVPVGHDEHRGAEPDPAGEAGQPGQRGERLVERHGVLLRHVGRQHDVVGHHQQVEAEALHGKRPAPQHVRIRARTEVRDVHAKPHRFNLSINHAGARTGGGMLEGVNDYGQQVMMPRARGR